MARLVEGERSSVRRLQELFYGTPERAVPYLYCLFSLLAWYLTGEGLYGIVVLIGCATAWKWWSARLVIDDHRLGPVTVTCPPVNQEGRPQVWLTFDDGPGPETPAIVETLNRHSFPATFFFIGEQLASYPQLEHLRELLQQGGHTVANHSTTHPSFLGLSQAETMGEIEVTQKRISRNFEGLARSLFRPPFGYRTPTTLTTAKMAEVEVIGWNINSLDFLEGPAERVVGRVMERVQPGSIILFHDGREGRNRTEQALPKILSRLKGEGYEGYSPT